MANIYLRKRYYRPQEEERHQQQEDPCPLPFVTQLDPAEQEESDSSDANLEEQEELMLEMS